MSNRCSLVSTLSIGRIAELACLLEVTAPKPGNVHRGADFEDASFVDFAASAVAMGHAIDATVDQGYGKTVLSVAQATTRVSKTNTNVGINLLISYLACTARSEGHLDRKATGHFKKSVGPDDVQDVYEAIRLMNPSGLGQVAEQDVHDGTSIDLFQAMELANDRDRVAAQLAGNFEDVFDRGLPWIVEGRERFNNLMSGIVFAHVRMMAEYPDSLIARKCGSDIARKSQILAAKANDAIADGTDAFFDAVSELDFWLRSDGHRRNPGTTADLIAAGLFVGLYNGEIVPPF